MLCRLDGVGLGRLILGRVLFGVGEMKGKGGRGRGDVQ